MDCLFYPCVFCVVNYSRSDVAVEMELRAASERDQTEYEEDLAQPFWGQPFCREIDETPIPLNFREVVVEPFSGGNDKLSYKLFSRMLKGVAM
ncbi:hypothetical protein CR513_11150, partial [Mucuna pruriens]